MSADLTLRCNCGHVTGRAVGITPRRCTRAICHCLDCQSFARHLGRADLLDDRGGSDIAQTSAWRIVIETGADQIACLRLSPKGLFRWYAACCNTPLANTLDQNRLSFAGLLVACLPDAGHAIGSVICRNGAKHATGEGASLRNFGTARAVFRILSRAIGARLSGKARQTPFFDSDRKAVVAPAVLTLEDRNAARQP